MLQPNMYHYSSPVMNFHNMLEYKLKTSGIEYPKPLVLGGVMINTMDLLVTKGAQARLGHPLMDQILTVSEEVMTLSFLSDIDVTFRFNTMLEVPLNILIDGNIIGLDMPTLYFKRKPIAPDQLRQAQVLFNFLSLVRLFKIQLGDEGVSELVRDFNKTTCVEILPNRKSEDTRDAEACTIRRTGTGARKATRKPAQEPVPVLGMLDPNIVRPKKTLDGARREDRPEPKKARDPTKRRGRLIQAQDVQDEDVFSPRNWV